ncbi:MAG: ABC transporter permease, partial [Actinobacteria bacterium]|nr:ABC transporter permease [Actinomycetota bacterium]
MENSATAATRTLSRHSMRVVGMARDTMAIAQRNLIDLVRVPQLLVFTLIQPIIFVIIFRYVFGGAIASEPGVPYVNYLMPGIFVQTVVFGSITTGVSMATDLKSGLVERFLSLPMTRTSVLAGRTISDLIRMVLVIALIVIVGFAVGFRVQTNALSFIAGLLLVLLFAYALLWVFVFVGLAVGDPESAQAASFPVIAPLVFASSALVPVSTMPSWLQGFATYQPVSATANAVRALSLGGPTLAYVLQTLAWCAGILLVFVPLSIWRYRHA